MTLQLLIVEDREDDAALAIFQLRRAGWEVESERVESREQMHAALEAREWDVIVADYVLPSFGALEALALVRQRGLDIPLIVFSGRIGEDVAAEAMRAGARDFVSKGNLSRLAPAVQRELEEAQHRRERRLTEDAMQLQALALSTAPTSIFITDARGRIEWVNQAFVRLTGYAESEAISRTQTILTPEPLAAARIAERGTSIERGDSWHGELPIQRKDGTFATVVETALPVARDSGNGHVLVVQEDVTAQRAAEARVESLTKYDDVTSLPNRALLLDRLAHSCARLESAHEPFAVVILEVDGIRNLGDTIGQPAADDALRAIAERLSTVCAPRDTVAYTGDARFGILVEAVNDDGVARRTATLLAAIREPLPLGGRKLRLGASAGIAVAPKDGTAEQALVGAATAALARSRGAGTGAYRFYSEELGREIEERLEFEQGLRAAIQDDDLWLEYQPQIELATGRVVAVEALARWGTSRNAAFVTLAGQMGVLAQLDDWVLKRACAQAVEWDVSSGPLRIAVNVSALHLREDEFVDTVLRVLNETALPASCLELEFTEQALGHGLDRLSSTLTYLSELGVHLSIDDFGTGYAPLGYLSRLPIERLKIDMSFVHGIGVDAHLEKIVLATIGFAHQLELRALAEGVETAEQLDFLRAAGCDDAQGFLLGAPRRDLAPPATHALPGRS